MITNFEIFVSTLNL